MIWLRSNSRWIRSPWGVAWAGPLVMGWLVLGSAAGLLAQDAGQAKLDEATERKLNAESPADLAKVIEQCEQALEAGLDEASAQLAQGMLASSALQRAQLLLQTLPRVVNNPNALRNLTSAAGRLGEGDHV